VAQKTLITFGVLFDRTGSNAVYSVTFHACLTRNGMYVHLIIGCWFGGAFTGNQHEQHNDCHYNSDKNGIAFSRLPFGLFGHQITFLLLMGYDELLTKSMSGFPIPTRLIREFTSSSMRKEFSYCSKEARKKPTVGRAFS